MSALTSARYAFSNEPTPRRSMPIAGLVMLLIVPAFFLWIDRALVPLLAHLAGSRLLLFATIVPLILMIYGLLGRDYGINRLFLHDRPIRRIAAAFAVTLLIINFVAVAYYISLRPVDPIARDLLVDGLKRFSAESHSSWLVNVRDSINTLARRFRGNAAGLQERSFEQESLGRLVSFIIVTAVPLIVIASLPAFFPQLARLGNSLGRRRDDAPDWYLRLSWPLGVLIGLLAAPFLLAIGFGIFLLLGHVPGLSGRNMELAQRVQSGIARLKTRLPSEIQPAAVDWLDFISDFHDLQEKYQEIFDRRSNEAEFRAAQTAMNGFAAQREVRSAVDQVFLERVLLPRQAAKAMAAAGAKAQAPLALDFQRLVVPQQASPAALENLGTIRDGLSKFDRSIQDYIDREKDGAQTRLATLAFLIVAFFVFLIVALVPWAYKRVTSAFSICLSFAFLATVLAAFECVVLDSNNDAFKWFADWLNDVTGVEVPLDGNGAWVLLVGFALIAWIAFANGRLFKFHFENLDYKSLKNLEALLRSPVDLKARTNDSAALEAWSASLGGKGRPLPRLVMVAVSGGAVRSGAWVTLVLRRLCKEIPGFAAHIRIITGASGGMVGAGYFAMTMRDHLNGNASGSFDGQAAVDRINRDSLDDVAKQLVLRDAPSIFFPWSQNNDRGKALERTWLDEKDRAAGRLDVRSGLRIPLHDLAALEQEGKLPSLIFSPMMVEDGRRLLISNLDVPYLTLARDHSLLDAQTRQIYGQRLSTSAVELRSMVNEAIRKEFLLSTAVRMSASFPYVSPATKVPTDPPRRVVDAGYYDNYGVAVAARWINHHQKDLKALTSGIVLVQIRDQASTGSRLGAGRAQPVRTRLFGKLVDAFSFLTSPPMGAESARTASASFRNDEDLMALSNLLNDDGEEAPFFTTVAFEIGAEVSLSWTISREEFAELEAQLEPPVQTSGATNPNLERLDLLKEWWGLPEAR